MHKKEDNQQDSENVDFEFEEDRSGLEGYQDEDSSYSQLDATDRVEELKPVQYVSEPEFNREENQLSFNRDNPFLADDNAIDTAHDGKPIASDNRAGSSFSVDPKPKDGNAIWALATFLTVIIGGTLLVFAAWYVSKELSRDPRFATVQSANKTAKSALPSHVSTKAKLDRPAWNFRRGAEYCLIEDEADYAAMAIGKLNEEVDLATEYWAKLSQLTDKPPTAEIEEFKTRISNLKKLKDEISTTFADVFRRGVLKSLKRDDQLCHLIDLPYYLKQWFLQIRGRIDSLEFQLDRKVASARPVAVQVVSQAPNKPVIQKAYVAPPSVQRVSVSRKAYLGNSASVGKRKQVATKRNKTPKAAISDIDSRASERYANTATLTRDQLVYPHEQLERPQTNQHENVDYYYEDESDYCDADSDYYACCDCCDCPTVLDRLKFWRNW